MATLLLKNIAQLVTCDDGDRLLQNVDLYCKDGFIQAIGEIWPSPPTRPSTPATCCAIPAW